MALRNLPHHYIQEMPRLTCGPQGVAKTVDPGLSIPAIMEVILCSSVYTDPTYEWRDLYESVQAAEYLGAEMYIGKVSSFLHLCKRIPLTKSTVRSRCGLKLKHIKRSLKLCCFKCTRHSFYGRKCPYCGVMTCNSCLQYVHPNECTNKDCPHVHGYPG